MISDDRLAKRIAGWLGTLPKPYCVEVRCRSEVIEAIDVVAESVDDDIAHELLDAASEDATQEGKNRSYELVAIVDIKDGDCVGDQQRFVCPLPIRRRGSKGDNVVDTLAKTVTDLHETLRKDRKEAFSMLLKYADTVGRGFDRMSEENQKNNMRASEVIEKLETVRSQQLERDMAKEKHDKDIEVRERITDAVIPLATAIASRVTGGRLPAPNVSDISLVQIIKSLNEEQLELLKSISGELWPRLERVIELGLSNSADLKGFHEIVKSMTPDQLGAVVQCLNIGQQAAIQELLHANNPDN